MNHLLWDSSGLSRSTKVFGALGQKTTF